MSPTLQAQVKAILALILPMVAGFLGGKVDGTSAAAWATTITTLVSAAYFVYDTLVVKAKVQEAHAVPPSVPLPKALS